MNEFGQVVGPRRGFVERMMAAARLDTTLYNEVEHDPSATSQAAAVVAIVAVCSAIGGLGGAGAGVVGGLIGALLGWLIWAAVTYVVGDKLLGGTASWGEMLRTLGFAQAPGVLYIGAAVPLLGWVVRVVVMVWLLFAGIVAIREAMDFTTGKAVLTAFLGWISMVLLMFLFAAPAALANL